MTPLETRQKAELVDSVIVEVYKLYIKPHRLSERPLSRHSFLGDGMNKSFYHRKRIVQAANVDGSVDEFKQMVSALES